ncbi:MAG TPA: CobD/CbiB family cobalamin biosynthesis protein [Acetobacteraceae bacterium]|nr:CobD/CbiB family cobalamin biosynthesis protein [Acetobacteraceae bacterium]
MTPLAQTRALAVLVAFAIDGWLGEPPARWHPVVWIGRTLASLGAPWPQRPPRGAFLRGAACWIALAALCTALAAGLQHGIILAAHRSATPGWVAARALLLGLALKPLLAWRMLRDEVVAVERALGEGLSAGRERLRRIVGRDVSELSPTVVRESALESLAENLNDSWVAPLFWFLVGGLPGAALYRFANTADAMWGVRGPFEWAGKWAARADDVLSCVPARLTALALALAAWRRPRGIFREARVTASPNGGWPMGTMALALNVRLSRPGYYVLNAGGRSATSEDLVRGLIIATRAAWGTALAASLLALP